MVEIRTVLCPVDFSPLSRREVQVAVEVCESFGARLILHHNLSLAPTAWSKTWEWEWEEAHHGDLPLSEEIIERKMQELLDAIPKSVSAEAMISRGLVIPVLNHLATQLPADLIVLGSHGWSNAEHTSIGDQLLESCPCPILTIRDGALYGLWQIHGCQDPPRALVMTDFSETGDQAVSYACELARVLPLRLHFLHVLPKEDLTRRLLVPAERRRQIREEEIQEARRRLELRIPEDFRGIAECLVRAGDPTEVMVSTSLQLEPQLLVMGRHARGFFQGMLTHDNSRELLHRSVCPVLFATA